MPGIEDQMSRLGPIPAGCISTRVTSDAQPNHSVVAGCKEEGIWLC